MKSYSKSEYEIKAKEANSLGQMLYILREQILVEEPTNEETTELEPVALSEDEDKTSTEESVEETQHYITKESLVIAPVNYYICTEANITDGTVNPNYEQEELEKYNEMINQLKVTSLDFLNMIKQKGVTNEEVNEFLESNLDIKLQLILCDRVYCGVAKSIAPFTIGTAEFTPYCIEEMFKQAFKIE